MPREDYNFLKGRYEALQAHRNTWDNGLQEQTDYIYPEGGDFQRKGTRGESLRDQLFDDTAGMAADTFAAGLAAFVIPRETRWLQLGTDPLLDFKDPAGLEWLEEVTELLLAEYRKPHVHFYEAMHQAFLSLAVWGTAPVYQEWSRKKESVLMKHYPLGACWIAFDEEDQLDTMFRRTDLTARQIEQKFSSSPGGMIPDEVMRALRKPSDSERTFQVVNAVMPRKDQRPGSRLATSKPWASFWFMPEHPGAILRNSGFNYMPYGAMRWTVRPGEVYGRSPGSRCLPSVRGINKLEQMQLRSLAKHIDPPNLARVDSIQNMVTTPASIIWVDPDVPSLREAVQPLENGGHYELGEDKIARIQDKIGRAFFNHLFERELKKERQSMMEIQDHRMQMLGLMGPHLARVESSLSEIIKTTYRMLNERGRIPQAPASLRGGQIQIFYTSPAARAQQAAPAFQARRFLHEDVVPLAQLDPKAMKVIKPEYLQYIAALSDVPRDVVATTEEVEEVQAQESQREMLQTVADTAQPVASALKDVSVAQKNGLRLFG